MTNFTINQERNMIPRWRTLDETAKLGELGHSARHIPPTPPTPPQLHDPLAQTKADWKKHRTIGHAADLVGAALFLEKQNEVQDAVEFLLHNESRTSRWVKKLAKQALPNHSFPATPISTPSNPEVAKQRIQELRSFIHDEPKDPITQVDLAHAFAILGHKDKASQHITIAQQLAPNNRFVLRSASRFWMHVEDKDQAHHILTHSDRTPHDPWLMAAEIAVANSIPQTPNYVQKARNAISEKLFQESHVSELAAAVATIDWRNGAVRKAKRLFNQSLCQPTENSIAQAVWVSSQDNLIDLNRSLWSRPNAYEAKARDFYLKREWKQATVQCELWQHDQPFSIGPALDGSFISIVALNDFHLAEQFALTGLAANHNEFSLLNNLAVALINLKNFDEAQRRLSQIILSKINSAYREIAQITKLATTGLLLYRTGKMKEGRQLYVDARSLAEKLPPQLSILSARATAAHALEESPQHPHYHQLIDEAIQLLSKHNDPACDVQLNKLNSVKNTTQQQQPPVDTSRSVTN